MNFKSALLWALSGIGTLALVSPSLSHAAFRRMGTHYCKAPYDNYGNDVYIAIGKLNNGTDSTLNVRCTIPTDLVDTHQDIGTFNVHGTERSGESNRSRACVLDFASATTSCGPYKDWGNGNSGASGLSVSAFLGSGREYWYPYLHTQLGPVGTLLGYYTN